MEDNLKQTPLYEDHNGLNARMVPFGGWNMPVQYEGILAEYHQTREAVSLFDISHMGEFIIEGDCVQSGLDRLVTMSIADMPILSCRYGAMLNAQGGIMDDLIVFRMEQAKWFLVVNGATTAKDAAHIRKNLTPDTLFQDVTLETGKVDVQGPLAREILRPLVEGIEKLEYYTFDFFELFGERVLISRTGYTGELGYEIYYPWGKTKELWNELLKDDRVKPAGLGARDVLRLEMGYSLYGHELEENISPLEAGLGRFVDLDKAFIGKEILVKQKAEGVPRRIVGFTSGSRRSPREGHYIYSVNNEEIGCVTSGTFSPAMNKGIGLGFVARGHGNRDEEIFFGNAKSKEKAIVTGRQFYKKGSLKY